MTVPGRPLWFRFAAFALLCACAFVVWKWQPWTTVDLHAFSGWLALHRGEWYALPLVVIVFVALGLVMVPVVLLIGLTGVAFGPLLGSLYAMAGCLASASTGFAIGRRVGFRRLERFGGDRVVRLARAVKRNGTLAVFLIRKVPAPFTLVNIVVGATAVRYRDFLIGTTLGMLAIVIAVAGLGFQLSEALNHPTPRTALNAAMFLVVPLTLAVIINHALRGTKAHG